MPASIWVHKHPPRIPLLSNPHEVVETGEHALERLSVGRVGFRPVRFASVGKDDPLELAEEGPICNGKTVRSVEMKEKL